MRIIRLMYSCRSPFLTTPFDVEDFEHVVSGSFEELEIRLPEP